MTSLDIEPIHDMRLRHDSSFLIAGPSYSGKTVLVQKMIKYKNEIFDIPPAEIYWCYGQYQMALFDQLREQGVHLMEGVPENLETLIRPYSFLVIDDLMSEVANSHHVTNIFTRITHHMHVTCVFLTQNLFQKGPEARTRSLNSSYLILMKNPRDMSQIRHLATQMFPNNVRYLINVYNDAVKKPFSYLLIDLRQETPDSLRLRSQIFPSDDKYTIYTQSNGSNSPKKK